LNVQNREGKAIANNGFPSISTFLNTDSFDSLRTPQADLSPTNFFSAERFNSFDSLSGLPQPNLKEPEIVGITPASFSLPQFPRNLDEPEIVGRETALFSSVPGSDPNLFSTAASVINALSASSDGNSNNDVSTDEPNQGGSETQELNLQPNGRYRRSVDSSPYPVNSFPSFYSFFHSSTPFSISFPSPNFTFRPDILEEFGSVQEPSVEEPQDDESLEPENLDVDLPENTRPTRQNRFRSQNNFRSQAQHHFGSQQRQNLRSQPPRYPPFDPFNTTYIPLPGPSSPNFALPLTQGNPHKRPRNLHFHRPVRHTTEKQFFSYHNSADFLKSLDFGILSRFQN